MHRFRAVALLVFLCLPALIAGCGGDNDASIATTTSSPARSEEAETCSASDLDLTLEPEAQLPAAVARTRTELFEAAVACDFEQLGFIAGSSSDFAFTFGEDEDPATLWKREDQQQRTLERLARLLTAPFIIRDEAGDEGTFAWPSVYQDAPTVFDYRALVRSGVYTQDESDAFQRAGSYFGYRVGITEDGDWAYFLAGR